MNKIVTFGEIMARVEAENFYTLRQTLPGRVMITFAGAEANVAASLSIMGKKTKFITALPDNTLSKSCISFLKGLDIECEILYKDYGRFGLYFLETGANQRASNVIYDREYSTISLTNPNCYNFYDSFKDCSWLHISGITPALSKECALTTIEAIKIAKELGLTVSFDLNYRGKLWNWDNKMSKKELARNTIKKIMPFVDIVIGNEEDATDTLNIKIDDNDINSGSLNIKAYEKVAKEIKHQYKNVKKVAFTLRESLSASHNNWGAILYDCEMEKAFFAPNKEGEYASYKIKNIVDRVGGGDSFSAGLIYALSSENELKENKNAISFAVAASCLCHSLHGDINYSSKEDVLKLMNGNESGRVNR